MRRVTNEPGAELLLRPPATPPFLRLLPEMDGERSFLEVEWTVRMESEKVMIRRRASRARRLREEIIWRDARGGHRGIRMRRHRGTGA